MNKLIGIISTVAICSLSGSVIAHASSLAQDKITIAHKDTVYDNNRTVTQHRRTQPRGRNYGKVMERDAYCRRNPGVCAKQDQELDNLRDRR